MRRDPLRRVTLSALLGAPLPLGFIAMQGEAYVHHADRGAFYILLPMLLFGMMAFAIWVLMRRPYSPRSRSALR